MEKPGQCWTSSPTATFYLTPCNPFPLYTNTRTHTHTWMCIHISCTHTTAENEHTQEMSLVVNKMLIAGETVTSVNPLNFLDTTSKQSPLSFYV